MHEPIIVTQELTGFRCDLAFAQSFPHLSRSRIKKLIETQKALIDGVSCTPKAKVTEGQTLTLDESDLIVAQTLQDQPEAIDLNIVYEDDDLLVINKPVGLVVHPGAGQAKGTLLNALLHYRPDQALLARAGIVHRLDKMTSGLMVVAKNEHAQQHLIEQLKIHAVERVYQTLVRGELISGGTIDAAVGRHPKDRKKMSVRVKGGKTAVTHYRILKRFRGYSLLEVRLETGRTHQIRVHMAHKNHPVVGDPVYAGRQAFAAKIEEKTRLALLDMTHQALHAYKLKLTHPTKNRPIQWKAPLPHYFTQLIDAMTAHPSALWESAPSDEEPEIVWESPYEDYEDEWDSDEPYQDEQ